MTRDQKVVLMNRLVDEINQLVGRVEINNFALENCPDEIDFAGQLAQQEVNIAVHQRSMARLAELGVALQRLKQDNAYGVCKECEDEIHPARLQANPSAQYCVVCQSEFEDGLKMCA